MTASNHPTAGAKGRQQENEGGTGGGGHQEECNQTLDRIIEQVTGNARNDAAFVKYLLDFPRGHRAPPNTEQDQVGRYVG